MVAPFLSICRAVDTKVNTRSHFYCKAFVDKACPVDHISVLTGTVPALNALCQ